MERNFFDYMCDVLIVLMVLLGIASLIGGIITGNWHCFVMAAIPVYFVIIRYREYKDNKKEKRNG